MMNILDKIIEQKKKEIAIGKEMMPVKKLEESRLFSRDTFSLKKSLLANTKTGIIGEFKKASPSKGKINDNASVEDVVRAYEKHGASGISVLTDKDFFCGSSNDLEKAREVVHSTPIIRKDFIIDEYQVIEAKAIGADVILLIAACLNRQQVKQLAEFSKGIGLEVLLELHDEKELEHICDDTELIGINNRSLKTFNVDIERSLSMAEKIPPGKIKIAESGISSVESIRQFKKNGFQGFLIGEYFMKEKDPGEAFRDFVNELSRP